MTDLQSRPWHTVADSDLSAARNEITTLTDKLRWSEHCRAQAEERVEGEKEATRAAEERAQAEEWRADGAEAHLRRVLAAFAVDPDGDLPPGVADSIAECIRQDLEGGLAVDEIPEQARRLVAGWQEETR